MNHSPSRRRLRASTLCSYLLLLAAAALSVGCPSHRARRTLVPTLPTSGDAHARHRLQQAQEIFERDRDGGGAVTTEFEQIAEAYPEDPVAPYALLYAGISSLRAGDYDRAIQSLKALDAKRNVAAGLAARAQLFYGIALAYRGSYAEALAPLQSGKQAIESDEERVEWHASMAESLVHGGRGLDALGHFDGWYDGARVAEKAYIIARIAAVIDAASDADVAARFGHTASTASRAPSTALLGQRVAASLLASGDMAGAERVRRQIKDARARIGLAAGDEIGAGRADGSQPDLIGAMLPLSGRRGRLGQRVARGLTLAAGAVGKLGSLGVTIEVRDTASGGASVEAQVQELQAGGAIALIGPVASGSVTTVSGHAARVGLPMISLDPRPAATTSTGHLFHVVQSAEQRARALARWAYGEGLRDFAVLSPKSGYGRAVSAAFRQQVTNLGGSVIVSEEYAPNETSFGATVKRLRKPWQAIFVAERADKLALIAPALAAANFKSRPVNTAPAKRAKRGRNIVLLSTAEALDPRYVRSAGRYSLGAVFAPGFYPDRFDSQIGPFVEAYEQVFDRLPTSWEAYAYDAASLIGSAGKRGVRSRAAMAAALAGARELGLTGIVRFGIDGRRGDDGLLFTVTRKDDAGLVIRAMR